MAKRLKYSKNAKTLHMAHLQCRLKKLYRQTISFNLDKNYCHTDVEKVQHVNGNYRFGNEGP